MKRQHLKVLGLLISIAVMALAGVSFAASVPAVPNKPLDIYSKNGMVSAAHFLASQAGIEIMAKGGNAIDAAAATACALHIVEPYNLGMGGGGFLTIRFAKTGEVVFLDFRERAPASARKDMYDSDQARKEHWSAEGGRGSGVPGWVKGWFYALEKYGTMTFEQVMQPALRLAENGYVWTDAQVETIMEGNNFEVLTNLNGDGAHVPYLEDELPLSAGSIIKHPGVAKAFRLLAKDGVDAFYKGPIGEAFIDTVNRTGGSMTTEDLARYEIKVTKPIEGTYRGYKIYSSPPPSSGGTHVIQLLNIMENFDIAGMKAGSPELMDLWGQAQRQIFADRDKYMADTAFAGVPLEGLTSKEYAKTFVPRLKQDKLPELGEAGDPWKFEKNGTKSDAGSPGVGREHRSTTAFSTVDLEGNIVSATNTINYWFGGKAMDPEFQILINNQMDDFNPDPASVNAPEPGKTPLSSMSPTIILDAQGKPFMTLGGAGGRMILTEVAQVISNVIDHKMTMSEAIEAPRIWNDMEGETILEATAGTDVVDALKKKGYDLNLGEVYHGVVQGILIDSAGEQMDAAADQRTGTGLPAAF